jgi:hypothetical protein
MSPLNPHALDIAKFKNFALHQLYAELYPLILQDFKHKKDIAAIIDAMTVIMHQLVKPLSGSYEAAGPARKAALLAEAKKGQINIELVENTGIPALTAIEKK